MFSHKTTAGLVGILFIVATVTAVVGGLLLQPAVGSDYLTEAVANEGQVITGVILELVLVLSVVAIAVVIYPVLRQRNEGMALGYAGARTIEATLLLAAAVSALLLLDQSRNHGQGGGEEAQALGDVLISAREWTYLLGSMVMLGVGGLILYSLLYRMKLVPDWLSIWGLIAAGLILIRGLIETYGVEVPGAAQVVLAAPIALQEMVMAILLIVKGFRIEAVPPPTV